MNVSTRAPRVSRARLPSRCVFVGLAAQWLVGCGSEASTPPVVVDIEQCTRLEVVDGGARSDGAVARDVVDGASDAEKDHRSCASAPMCGAEGDRVSCCASIELPAGTCRMGRSVSGSDAFAVPNPEELPEHDVPVRSVRLDRFEVTVSRFRAFVDAWTGQPVCDAVGANPTIMASGWKSEWNASIPHHRAALTAALRCDGEATWTDTPGPNEERPIVCLDWYTAFAFCAWDGGRLPTEAEWEYAASGGDENRTYTWGSEPPTCERVSPLDRCHGPDDLLPRAGRHRAGAARWGHEDMAGGAAEWVLDWWGYYRDEVLTAFVRLDPPPMTLPQRVLRGGGYYGSHGDLRAADRTASRPELRSSRMGVRCAYER